MLILRTIARPRSPDLYDIHPVISCLFPLTVPFSLVSSFCSYVSSPSSVGLSYQVRIYPLNPENAAI